MAKKNPNVETPGVGFVYRKSLYQFLILTVSDAFEVPGKVRSAHGINESLWPNIEPDAKCFGFLCDKFSR